MVSQVALFSTLLLNFVALVIPLFQQGSCLARGEGIQSQFSNRSDASSQNITLYTPERIYNYNWGGGRVIPRNPMKFNVNTGSFIVPPALGVEGSGALIFVGLGDSTCGGGGRLSAGLHIRIKDGLVQYIAAYNWYPARVNHFSANSIIPGDIMVFTVVLITPTLGMAFVENYTKGWMMGQRVTSGSSICDFSTAQWVVEDYMMPPNSYVPLVNFHTVTFEYAVASGNGISLNPLYAKYIYDMQQGDQILTDTYLSIINNNVELLVNYIQ